MLKVDRDWWRQAAIYQIYPRSFKDSNGDGVGDLRGIINEIPYLASLNLDAVWLSPFYPSALADGGYDVDDYRDVDPLLGTLADFDEMLEGLHNVGIRVFVDIVPNHSSNLHEWFKEAIASEPGSAARHRYIFRDGKGANGELPPTNWPSHFEPSAWTHEREMGGKHNQWYCHLFAKEQPDWNWDNREVEEDFLKTLKFWSDRGVDGFRIDVAHALKKDLSEPLKDQAKYPGFNNPMSGDDVLFDRNEVHEVYREWRKLFDQYNPPRVAVAEAYVRAERAWLYSQPDELGQTFNFELISANFNAAEFKSLIERNFGIAKEHGSSTTWVFSNHDKVRHATRWGLHPSVNLHKWLLSDGTSHPLDREMGVQAGLAATMLILALPGCTYIYQGEELGLHEVADIPSDQIQDPQYERNNRIEKGRDGCRVPLPWKKTGPSFGFGTGGSHLPQPAWFGDSSVEAEDGVKGSPLEIYRAALKLRRELQGPEDMTWHPTTNRNVLHFSRPNGWQSITNFGSDPYDLAQTQGLGKFLHSSHPMDGQTLPPATTAWFKA